MTRQTTVVQVFVASPSDVKTERDSLEGIVEELNRTWSRTLGVTIELVKWETHVRPAFGTDPQSVVNTQIGDDYDAFIGILWGRFGTPTSVALSGTEEEFEKALERFRREGSPEIMIYFKDTPLAPSDIDPEQLALVKKFRKGVTDKGGIHSTFVDESGFQSSLHAHLASLAQHFAGIPERKTAAPQSKTDATEAQASDDEDDLGFLDYVDIYNSRMADLTAIITTITEATSRIGKQMQGRTKEIEELSQGSPSLKTARHAIKRAADDMVSYSNILEKQLPLMTSSREESLRALAMALALYQEFGHSDETDLRELRENVSALLEAAKGSQEHLAGYHGSVKNLPRMTGDLNRAKRSVLQQLQAMLSELSSTEQNIANIYESINEMLAKE